MGKQVVVVANLAPRKMRGLESQGMILMTENPEGRLVFVNPDTSTAPLENENGNDVTDGMVIS